MKFPQVVVLGLGAGLANQLRDFVADARWLLADLRQPAALAGALAEARPTVLLIEASPAASPDLAADRLALVGEWHRARPDAAIVVVSDAKLPDDRRALWTASALDLGARWVLYPPFTRLVLDDLVGGLMASALGRLSGERVEPFAPRPAAPDDAPLDLAAGDYEEPA